MALDQHHIDELFAFTRKKYVHYYDLQVELVDHLATGIEEEMAADASLNFEQALNKVYSRFGIFGFAQIVKEKTKAANKEYFRWEWQEFLKQFTWPNVVRSLCIALVIFTLSFNGQILLAACFSFVIAVTYSILAVRFVQSNLYKKKEEKWWKNSRNSRKPLLLLEYVQSSNRLFSGFNYMYFFMPRLLNSKEIIQEPWQLAILSVLFFLSIILSFSGYTVLKGIIGKAQRIYPEAFA